MAFLDIFMDVSHTLEMAICVVNQLKNDSYCQGLQEHDCYRQDFVRKGEKDVIICLKNQTCTVPNNSYHF